ncbi:MAG: hypothetical protein AAFN10_07600 [Bacteroidota bacterium]
MEHNQSSMEEPRLDDFFREKMEDFSPPAYDPTAWDKLASRMPAAATGPILWYWISGSLGVLLLFSWLYFLSSPSGERQIVQQLDSLQQQINQLTQAQSQIQKDTVYVYLSDDSLHSIVAKANPTKTISDPLTHAQNVSIGRSANSRTNTNFNPKAEVNPPSVSSEGDFGQANLSHPSPTHLTERPTSNVADLRQEAGIRKEEALSMLDSGFIATPSENASSLRPNTQTKFDSTSLAETNKLRDSSAIIVSNTLSPRDSSLSVRQQPETQVRKERSRILQNWLGAREIRAGLQVGGGSLLRENIGSAFQSGLGLYLESNLSEDWWLRTGLDFAYRSYEGENEDGALDPLLLAALPGLVDPVTAADLKEFYMRGYSVEIPLSIRREFYLNQNWDWGIQASIAAHRYFRQSFEYQSITEEQVDYQSLGTEQQWSLSPVRLTLMAIHSDRFRPSLGLYGEYELMAKGVEPIRFWSIGMQASFGLQLR